jgi:formiminoglutamase
MSDFQPVERKLFYSANDPHDPRLGDLAQADWTSADVAIVGYPDDEGVLNNRGRAGSALGPHEIRHWLYRMTPHARRPIKSFSDAGDLQITRELERRHQSAQEFAGSTLKRGIQLLSLGGGNDYAYPDGMAFLEAYAGKDPLIINVDAHLDVRDLGRGLTSGTPFFRLLESAIPFEFIELGIQGQCNSSRHWDYVEGKGGKILSLDQILDSGRSLLDTTVQTFGDTFLRRRPTFLAIDIDAFAWPFALGSSAAWPLGLEPQQFWPLFQFLLKRMDVRALGIYEVAPILDPAGGTARLAAQMAHSYLHHV